MCGRYSFVLELRAAESAIDERYPASDVRWALESRDRYADGGGSYNVAPGSQNPVVTRESPERLRLQRWGLVPHWADDGAEWNAINARSETVHENGVFRECFRERRCLVPAQGFYEWRERDDGPSEPYRIVPRDAPHDLFLFAGVWSAWTPPERQASLGVFGDDAVDEVTGDETGAGGGALHSYAILTMPANDAVAPIHDRMPVALRDDELATWLRGSPDEARELLDEAGLASHEVATERVSRAVNDAGNDGEELWRAV